MIQTAAAPTVRPTTAELADEYYRTIPVLHPDFRSAWRWANATGQPAVTAWAWLADGKLHKLSFNRYDRQFWTDLGALTF